MKTKTELLAELEQAQKRIAELENALASNKSASEFPKDPVLRELHTSEKHFAALFRSNPIPVGFTRASDYRIMDVNDAWSALTGYTREEALGHTSNELGLAKSQTLQHIRDMLQDQGKIRQNEILLYTRTGQERHVLVSSEPIEIDGEGYFLNNLLDVTEQRLAEKKNFTKAKKYSVHSSNNLMMESCFQMRRGRLLNGTLPWHKSADWSAIQQLAGTHGISNSR